MPAQPSKTRIAPGLGLDTAMTQVDTVANREVFVLDTNVLLTKPQVIEDFPDAEVVIPQVVLAELDKVKASRADMDLRYRGREISRRLFELSEQGKLSDGVVFGRNVLLRVATYQPDGEYPPALRNRHADDQIIALAQNLHEAGRSVVLVTNDLNMLLKAQSIDLPVQRMEFGRPNRVLGWLVSRRFQRQVFPALIVVLLAVLAVFMYQLVNWFQLPEATRSQIADEQSFEHAVAQLEDQVKADPANAKAVVSLGHLYFNRRSYGKAIEKYTEAVKLNPRDADVRINLAVSYANVARPDVGEAILRQVVKEYPNHALAHYDRGAILLQMARFEDAKVEFEIYRKLEPDGQYANEALVNIQRIDQRLAEQRGEG